MAKPSIVHVNFVTDICELFVSTFTLIQQLSSLLISTINLNNTG